MYGLWLFKEIKTEYGYCKVEIYRKGYTASAIEIGAIVGNSLSLALENLDTITAPIGKSVCSFEIYDTDQIEYDDLFTPDATAYKVVVSTKVDGGEYVTRWSGYITPDFFAENLSYRTPIIISARDNIGYLNDVDFDLEKSSITIRELIESAFKKIADDYPMEIVFATQKQTGEGILAIDATISTILLREGSWYEAIETLLHDLGLQMRWVDNNTIAVIDVSQIPEYYTPQTFNFIGASGYREILPAWRELSQEQSYGVLDNFYKGQIDEEEKLEYAANSVISANILLYQPKTFTQWQRSGEVYFLNFYNSYNAEIDDDKLTSVFITGVSPNVSAESVLQSKMIYSQVVTEVKNQIKLTFNLNDTLRTPLNTTYSRGERNTLYLPKANSQSLTAPLLLPYQLKYRFNVFLHANDGTSYVMREEWVDVATLSERPFIEFITEELQTVDTGVVDSQGRHKYAYTGYNNNKEYSIIVNSIPKAGTLEFVVYPWTFENDTASAYRDEATFQRGAKISDIQFKVQVGKTGVSAITQVGINHNVKNNDDYQFGEVPQKEGDIITYAGGLFHRDTITALQGFQRNADATNYNLLELVGREIIHFNKKNYNKLSGTIRNLKKEPLMFNRLFTYNGKKYAPFAYSLNVISNEMNITTMQEVEPYVTADLAAINSAVTTGGATVGGGGNNTILQYSQDAGNTKRIYELDIATEEEKSNAWIMVDSPSLPEAKRVSASSLGHWIYDPLHNALRTDLNLIVEGTIGMGSLGEGGSGEVATPNVTIQFDGSEILYTPDANGIITLPAYPEGTGDLDISAMWQELYSVDATKVIDSSHIPDLSNKYLEVSALADWALSATKPSYAFSEITSKPTTLAGYGITDALPLNGGTLTSSRFSLNGTGEDIAISLKVSNAVKTQVGWDASNGSFIYDYTTGYQLSIKPDGNAYFYNGGYKKLIHSGNYSDYALPLTGGTLAGKLVLARASNANIEEGGGLQTVSGGGSGYESLNLPYGYANVFSIGVENSTLQFAWQRGTTTFSIRQSENSAYGKYYTLIHSGNYANTTDKRYLQLSGGTITTGDIDGFSIYRNNSNRSAVHFFNTQDGVKTDVGYLGVIANLDPVYISSGGTTYHLIHSNNYSNYALSLSGGTFNFPYQKPGATTNPRIGQFDRDSGALVFQVGTSEVFDIVNSGWTKAMLRVTPNEFSYYGNNIIHSGNIGSYTQLRKSRQNTIDLNAASNGLYEIGYSGQNITNGPPYNVANSLLADWRDANGYAKLQLIGDGSRNTLWFRAQQGASTTITSEWRQIAFADSNVASATKLQTARTIWGQSFDGTGNVDGHIKSTLTDFQLYYNTNKLFLQAGATGIFLGEGTADTTYLSLHGTYIRLRIGSSEKMRIANSGNVLIGTTADNGAKLQVNGDINSSGTIAMAKLASSSDRKLKDNIAEVSAEQSMGIIRQLRPTTWNWKKDGKKSYGFIAQEVEPIVPEMVVSMEHLHLEYNQLHAFEIGAIKHIDSEVERLKEDLATANERIEVLEQELNQYRRSS